MLAGPTGDSQFRCSIMRPGSGLGEVDPVAAGVGDVRGPWLPGLVLVHGGDHQRQGTGPRRQRFPVAEEDGACSLVLPESQASRAPA